MVNQLQQQLQRLRDEANSISQLAVQLYQTEQNNSSQLQQLQQKEVFAAQSLQRIHYLASQLQQDLSQAGNIAQQLTSASFTSPAQMAYQYTEPRGYAPSQFQSTTAYTGWSPQPAWGQTAWAGQTSTPQRSFTPQYGYGASQMGISQVSPVQQSGTTQQAGMMGQYTTTPGQWSATQRSEAQFGQGNENQL